MPLYPKVEATMLLLNCVNHVLLPFLTNTKSVIVIDFEQTLIMPVTIYGSKQEEPQFSLEKPDVYIVESRNINLNYSLTYLEKYLFLNPRATFVIVTKKVNDSLTAARNFLLEKTVILEQISLDQIVVHSYEPFKKNRNRLEIDVLSRIASCTDETIEDYDLHLINPNHEKDSKIPKVRVGTGVDAPAIVFTKGLPTSGIHIEMLELISEKLGLETQLIKVDDFSGAKNPEDSTFNGSLGFLQRKEVDFVIGGILPTWEGSMSFDFTIPISINRFAWVVPAAKLRPLWKRVLFTYSYKVWILYLITLLVILAILSTVNRFIIKGHFNWGTELLKLYSMSLTSVEVKSSETKSKKTLYISWYLFLLIFLNYFTAKLLSNLVVKKYEYQIHDLHEQLDNNWKICVFSDLTKDIGNFDHERMSCTSCASCVNQTAYEGDVVSIRSLDITLYEMKKFYTNKDHEPLIFIIKQYFLVIHDSIAFRKNHPIFERFNEVLSNLIESGFYEHIKNKYISSESDHDRTQPFAGLKIRQVRFIFRFLSCGLVLSFVVFVCEISMKIIVNARKRGCERTSNLDGEA